MAYVDFPDGEKGIKERKRFWMSHEGCALIAGWRRQGTSLNKIATEYIGVSKRTFWNWYGESDDIKKAAATGKDIANMQVEEALLKRCLGYDAEDLTHELVEGELRLIRRYTHHVPPDVKACLSWLFNRMPDRWRAQQEPLESTEYQKTIKEILVAMKEVAINGDPQKISVTEEAE